LLLAVFGWYRSAFLKAALHRFSQVRRTLRETEKTDAVRYFQRADHLFRNHAIDDLRTRANGDWLSGGEHEGQRNTEGRDKGRIDMDVLERASL